MDKYICMKKKESWWLKIKNSPFSFTYKESNNDYAKAKQLKLRQ